MQWLKPDKQNDYILDGSFQEAIGPILVIAQCFGVMPVVGVKSRLASELRFKWNSLRTIYSYIAFLLTFIYAAITLWITFSKEIHFDRMSEFHSNRNKRH